MERLSRIRFHRKALVCLRDSVSSKPKIWDKGAVLLIEFYRASLSLVLPHSCRFYPSCSEYMQEAIKKRGVCLGLKAGLLRLLRCHPFHAGGYDPLND